MHGSDASSDGMRNAISIQVKPPQARSADGALLLADIGGYSAFLRSVQTEHEDDAFADGNIPDAYGLVSSLLDGIVGRLVPPFTLSKLEGDAVFVYAEDPGVLPRGTALLEYIVTCYEEFRTRLASAHEVWSCRCDACARIDRLELKFIVHTGQFVIQRIAGTTELAGPEVVMAHRLLKNEAAAAVGTGAYVLFTAVAATRFGLPRDGALSLLAQYAHYPPIETLAYPLRGS